MRIAICDDHIADRRHAERLLKRECDRLHALGEEGHVVDCFGNTEMLYLSADSYDIFFIDMTENPGEDGLTVAMKLREMKILSPIVLCSGEVDYRARTGGDDSWYYLDKPFTPEPLLAMVRLLGTRLVKREPLVELRTDGETIYARHEDILYATETGMGYLTVGLRNRDPVRVLNRAGALYSFMQDTKYQTALVPLSSAAFVNTAEIAKKGLLHVEMKDGTRLSVSPACRKNIK